MATTGKPSTPSAKTSNQTNKSAPKADEKPTPAPTQTAQVKPASDPAPSSANTCGKICPQTSPNPAAKPADKKPRTKAERDADIAKHDQERKEALKRGDTKAAEEADLKAAQVMDEPNTLGAVGADVFGLLGTILGARRGRGRTPAKTTPGPAPAPAPKAAPTPPPPAATPKTASAKNGGHVMAKKKVDCFKAGDKTKNKTKEYDKQLADQEKGLNDMTVQEYLDGRQKFDAIGRKGTGAAQQAARAKHAGKLTSQNLDALGKQGVTGAAASQQAAQMTASKMKTLAALHNPDMIAGGKDAVTAMGDRGVNSSIGGQWKDKVKDLDASAKQVPASERAATKMNVKLSRCP